MSKQPQVQEHHFVVFSKRLKWKQPFTLQTKRPLFKHWGIVQMHRLQPLPPNFHFFPPTLQKDWIWSGPIGVWIMKGLPVAGRGPVIPRTGELGFWVGFGWVPLLCDACTLMCTCDSLYPNSRPDTEMLHVLARDTVQSPASNNLLLNRREPLFSLKWSSHCMH